MNSRYMINCMWYEGVSVDDMANCLGISKQELYDKIYGEREFTPEEREKAAELLKLTREEAAEVFDD